MTKVARDSSTMGLKTVAIFVLITALCPTPSLSFVVPGTAPQDYMKDDPVEVKAVKLTSDKAQLPYEYYSLPFCKTKGALEYKSENLGEILRGDRIVNTPYDIKFLKNQSCQMLCGADAPLSPADIRKLAEKIREEYSVHLIADNLPVATPFKNIHTQLTEYEIGYRLGAFIDSMIMIHNYLQFVFKYHQYEGETTFRIVGFEVYPRSVSMEDIELSEGTACRVKSNEPNGLFLKPNSEQKVPFAYEVEWQVSPVAWASRWDTYLARKDGQIHWFNILNALIIVLLMSGIVTVILIRTLRRDIAKYNAEDDMETHLEESGWKMVHGDVFRPPPHPRLLSTLIGSGIQILSMFGLTIGLAMLGFLSPASRGSIMSGGIFLYCFMGLIAGYHAGRLYSCSPRTMKGQQWKSGALWTGTLFPGSLLAITFVLNFFIWGKKSSGAVPFTIMLAILAIWLGIMLPLVFLGYYFGYRKQPYTHPVQVKHIPRVVPEQSWHNHPFLSTILAGLLPFGAVFLELSFIFTAIWKHEYYFLFGFLFLVFLILIVTTAQVSIIIIYFQLCNEDYNWWWRSFLSSCGPAIYLFLYTIVYFYFRLEITEFVPALLYFGYSMLMVVTFALLTGAIGFIAAYFFIRKIYSAVKID